MAAARARLAQERKDWRKEKPFGFTARPDTAADGSINLMRWTCLIPGKEGTDWEGGLYPLTIVFTNEYPSKPPICSFPAGFFHPNVYAGGKVCLSILNEDEGWKPSISLKQILLGIQELLDTPNNQSPAQILGRDMLRYRPAEYKVQVRMQAKQYAPKE